MAKVKSGVCQVAGRAKRESPLVRLPRRDNRAVSQRLSNLSAAQGGRGGTGRKKKERERGAIGSMEYHLVSQWKTWLSEAGARGCSVQRGMRGQLT